MNCVRAESFRVCVVIPCYRERFEEYEQIALRQCGKILNKHQVYIVAPEGLETARCANYIRQGADQVAVMIATKFFPANFFQDIAGYNRLMMSSLFYDSFGDFSHMLIYQTDCFVFNDALDTWVQKNFSYIGAPWFEDFSGGDPTSPMLPFSGNGGFSLRNIADFSAILCRNQRIFNFRELWQEARHRKGLKRVLEIAWLPFRLLGIRNNRLWMMQKGNLNEDTYFSIFAPRANPEFIPASAQEAISFSFECQPRRLFDLNAKQLPFGCHAWQKYDLEFWKPFVAKAGYEFKGSEK